MRVQRLTQCGAVAVMLLAAACTSRGRGAAPEAAPPPAPVEPAAPTAAWTVRTIEHVDLWLHGYALLMSDTARIPFFRRGYREEMYAQRTRANVVTMLDANREILQTRLASNPGLINSQFLPLHFLSWPDMEAYIDFTLRAEGDPRRMADDRIRQAITLIAGYFPNPGDREWLRVFAGSLRDERGKYFQQHWLEQRLMRERAVAALDSLWRGTYYEKFRRFLTGTRQVRGEIIPSAPIGGEGRTLPPPRVAVGDQVTRVVVSFPPTPERAVEPIYVFAHEMAGTLARPVVDDNTTPAEQRNGVRDRILGALYVRSGAMLLQRVAPELEEGYMRYYLHEANIAAATNVRSTFTTTFPLSDVIRDAFLRQLDAVLAGI